MIYYPTMSACEPLHNTTSNDELIALCFSPTCEVIGGSEHGTKVVKISEEAVIKFGYHLEEQEVKNQQIAYELLNHHIVRVPLIYRFFTSGESGFIVMEYIKGQIIEPLEDPSRVRRIANILAHFTKIRGSRPGPLGGGFPRGLLWPESEDLFFKTVQDVESYVNSRLRHDDPKLVLEESELIICHLDIAPRNILWLEDDSICFLDWQSAGFYPRLFEFCGQYIVYGFENGFNQKLLEYMDNLTDEEEAQKEIILLAWHNQQRYHL